MVVARSVRSCSGSSSASSFEGRDDCAGDLRDLQGDVLWQALGGLLVGAVKLAGEPLERLLRLGVEVKAGADLGLRGGPRGAAQELGARVGEPPGARDEHVAAVERSDQCLQHAE